MNLDLQFRECTLYIAGTKSGEARSAQRETDCERTAINLQSIKYDYGRCEEEWLSAESPRENRQGKRRG